MHNLFARRIIHGSPSLLSLLVCHSNSGKLHEKLQLIFNKYIAPNITSVERWRRAGRRDVPRLAYSKQPEVSGQRLIIACGEIAQDPINSLKLFVPTRCSYDMHRHRRVTIYPCACYSTSLLLHSSTATPALHTVSTPFRDVSFQYTRILNEKFLHRTMNIIQLLFCTLI